MPESKKVVLKVDVHDNKQKRNALKAVSKLSGIESLAMDMKDKKLTVIGDVDPVDIVKKLKKCWHTEILTVGPPKDDKKDDKKSDKKDDKQDDEKKRKEEEEFLKKCQEYWARYPYMNPYYRVYSIEENPNSCVIC